MTMYKSTGSAGQAAGLDQAGPETSGPVPASAAADLGGAPEAATAQAGELSERSIGDIIAEVRNLSAEQVQRVLALQQQKGLRFGEAAVELGLATRDDVLQALAQQFHYPYAGAGADAVGAELVTLHEPFGERAEAFRALRSQLMMRVFGIVPKQALAVISADVGDGKTYTTANLGVALAQLGSRTLIVDADMRSPRMHEVFGVSNRAGLSGILSGRMVSKVIQQVNGVPSLYVLPVGAIPPNPLELIERPAFGLLLKELSNKFDHLLVDTPAVSVGSDAGVVASRCGQALIVARLHQSRVRDLQRMLAGLAGSPAQIAGVVANAY